MGTLTGIFLTVNNLTNEAPPANTRSSVAPACPTQHVSLRHGRLEIHRRIASGFLIGNEARPSLSSTGTFAAACC